MKKSTSIYWMRRKDYWWCETTKQWVTGINGHPISSIRQFKDKRGLLSHWRLHPDAIVHEWENPLSIGLKRMYELEHLSLRRVKSE